MEVMGQWSDQEPLTPRLATGKNPADYWSICIVIDILRFFCFCCAPILVCVIIIIIIIIIIIMGLPVRWPDCSVAVSLSRSPGIAFLCRVLFKSLTASPGQPI